MFSFTGVLTTLLSLAAARPLDRRDVAQVPGFDYANDKIRGVNLGGWFVLEPYMNPSFFNQGWDPAKIPVDEYHYTQYLGKDKAFENLDKHWDTWIQESDFEKIAGFGLNFVRIPIGYWAVLARPEDPYVQGQIKYLDRALGWAKNHNIKVWIDLHGVPGSQNGLDNSGLRDHIDWQDSNTTNIQDTYAALDVLIDRYGKPDYYNTVIGIQIVNEPLGAKINMNELHDFYNESYEHVRKVGDQGAVYHDAFEPLETMSDWLNTPEFYNVIIDHHWYQFSKTNLFNETIDKRVEYACNLGKQMKSIDNKWHVVGEWSAALTDCTPLLNGVYRGSRYDGSFDLGPVYGSCEGVNDITKWSNERKENVRRYVEAQIESYEYGSSGWVIWAYKTEDAIEWDLSNLVENGLFPQPLSDRKYPNQCNFSS